MERLDGVEAETAGLPEWISPEVKTLVNIGTEALHYSYFLYDAIKFKDHVLTTNKSLSRELSGQKSDRYGKR
jgi:hypothetical protein